MRIVAAPQWRIGERKRQRRYQHSSKGKLVQLRYRKSDKGRRCQVRYNQSNKGAAARLARDARRRARKRKATAQNCKAITKIYIRAAELRQWFDVVVDHIIPLAKGGAHEASSLQIIYRIENLRKGARLNFKPSVVFV